MADEGAQAEGITMSGGGLYSLATLGAKDVIDGAMPLLEAAVDAIPTESFASGFTLADMGCADGGTSLDAIGRVIGRVRSRVPGVPVTVASTDQPRNDFNALMANVHGLGPFVGFLDGAVDVFPIASGTSFYRQALPSGSVHLGFSATAMHWLSGKPGDISDHVHMVGASGAELEAFRARAHDDWRQILLCRAAELVSGGRLVLVNFCIDGDGRHLGNTGGIDMFETFARIWSEFLAEGRIDRDEYVAMTLPQYYNTVEEFTAPLVDPDDPVCQAGLRLEHVETRVVRCPFAADFEQHGDVERFVQGYIPTIRTWNESIWAAALHRERPVDERARIIEDYYARYADRVRAEPEGHGMDYVHAYLVIAKA